MKNIQFNFLPHVFACLFSFNANAQSNPNEKAVLKMWNDVWQAYESGNEAKMWSFYTEDACEIYPDGSQLCGLKAIRDGYEQFKTMLDGKPSWRLSAPTINFVEPNVAILTADVDSDIKLTGGQQIGGKSKFMTVLHKVKGEWRIVFDSQTPVMQMPENN